MKLAQVLVVVLVGVCWANGQVEPTDAPAETTAAPAETTAAPAETTAAPAETTTTAKSCIPPNGRCNPITDTCCSRDRRRTCKRPIIGVFRCRV